MNGFLKYLLGGFACCAAISLGASVFGLLYFIGFFQGYNIGKSEAEIGFIELINTKLIERNQKEKNGGVDSPSSSPTTTPISPKSVSWGGPVLWELVNKRRGELGVNALGQRDELCTIASLRLNELLKLGELDGHSGFGNLKERRPDLAWIFDEFSVVAEFLALGGDSAAETVSLWENTLGHRKILDGGEFVWGCIYAQNSFAVGITAY